MTPSDEQIGAVICELALARGRDKTFCPSEVARHLAADWRPLMPRVRDVAATLDNIVATQGGDVVDPVTARGPVRLGLRKP